MLARRWGIRHTMKIALVFEHASPLAVLGETEVSGRHTYIAGLARALADRGHDVVVFTRRDAWPSTDPDGLVAAIRRVLDDEALSERLGEQGRRRAVAHYDWKHVAERVEGTYEEAVNSRSATAAAS